MSVPQDTCHVKQLPTRHKCISDNLFFGMKGSVWLWMPSENLNCCLTNETCPSFMHDWALDFPKRPDLPEALCKANTGFRKGSKHKNTS